MDVDAAAIRDLLRGTASTDLDPRGVRLRGARVRGRLDLDQVDAACPLVLEECLLEDGISAVGAHLRALIVARCRVEHPTQPALDAAGVRVDGPVVLAGSTLRAGAAEGAVVLVGARIGGDLDCRATVIANTAGSAMSADRAQIDNNVLFEDGVDADGVGERGTLRFTGARIGGRLGLRDADLRNPGGPALSAVDLRTFHGLFLEGRFHAEGAGRRGAIYLRGAHVGGEFDCRGARLTNPSGPALLADGIRVDRVVFLNDGFQAHGAGESGAVRLLSGHISGRVNCRGGHISNPSGPALVADRLRTEGDILLDNGFTATGTGPRGTVRLRGTTVGGGLDLTGSTVESRSAPEHRWLLDGLTYIGVPHLADRDNRAALQELLRTATPSYAAQPYQQLAAAYRSEGHDGDARAVLMQQRRDQLDRGALTDRRDRVWARVTGALLGYGYRPSRALVYLVGVLAVSVALTVLLGGHGALTRTPDQSPTAGLATAPQRCSTVQLIGKGLDLGTPFLSAARAGAGSCEVTATTTGETMTVARWILQLAAWALAALFIAGFTRVVRRS